MPFRSLRALTLAFLLLFVGVTLATGFAIYSTSQRTIRKLVDQRIGSESNALLSGTNNDPREIERRIGTFAHNRTTGDLGFALADADGRHIAGNIRPARRLPLGFSTMGSDDGIEGLSYGRALVRRLDNGLMLTTVAETEPFDTYHAARIRIYVKGFGAIILLVVSATLLFGALIRRRIIEMRRTVDAIIDGDLHQRVPVDGSNSEFDLQAQAFNRMLDRIEALMREIANVSNDIAHDLRTPLARMRHQLEKLTTRPEAAGVQEELGDALAEADQLLAMFAAILRIAEVEGGERRAGFTRFDLGALAAEVAETMKPVVEEGGHRLATGPCDPVELAGDRRLLTQVLVNLIENAMRHTPPGTTITVGARAEPEGGVTLIVADDGPGIPEAARGKAMRRFGRLDPARNHGGYGLGLSLADAITRLHHGVMALEDAGPGLRVAIRLPRR